MLDQSLAVRFRDRLEKTVDQSLRPVNHTVAGTFRSQASACSSSPYLVPASGD